MKIEIQCTDWQKPNSIIKFGKVVFVSQERYQVPEPRRETMAKHWCATHAAKINGYIKNKSREIAVFKMVDINELRKR